MKAGRLGSGSGPSAEDFYHFGSKLKPGDMPRRPVPSGPPGRTFRPNVSRQDRDSPTRIRCPARIVGADAVFRAGPVEHLPRQGFSDGRADNKGPTTNSSNECDEGEQRRLKLNARQRSAAFVTRKEGSWIGLHPCSAAARVAVSDQKPTNVGRDGDETKRDAQGA